MVDNHPSARAKPEGEGVVIDHKSPGYCAVTIILSYLIISPTSGAARE